MKEQLHSMPVASSVATEKGETVSIYVDHNHPLLQLKRALPWEALFEVITRHWRRAGKNTDGRPGLAWDVTLYVPLLVLMLVKNLKTRRVGGVDHALDQVQTILRSVKEHHLFAKGKQVKRQVLTRLLTEVGQLVVHTRPMVTRLGQSRDRVTQRATATLVAMHEVAKRLIPQIVQWITTGVVAKGKIIHAGVTQARAIVRHKAGKQVEFG